MDFRQEYVDSIEQALETQPSLRGRWRRLTSVETNPSAKGRNPVAAWRIEIPEDAVTCPNVSELWVLLDEQFPFSQPRVLAPSLSELDCNWPHIEEAGLLCLTKTSPQSSPGSRVLRHLEDAIQLLNFDEVRRINDFQEEFATYWARGDVGKPLPKQWSLVTPQGPSREVFLYFSTQSNCYIWGDSKQMLEGWLRNTGRNPSAKSMEPAWAIWLPEAPIPADFPKVGAEILSLIPAEIQQRLIRAGEKLPVLVGAPTVHGPVWVAAVLDTAPERDLQKGFRTGRIPFDRVMRSMASRPVRRQRVERVDGAYVHGRGRNDDFAGLSTTRVALFGCGSLGSSIARMLAQAGVGGFVMVDGDFMVAHNTSRHVLGNRTVGLPKADALANALEMDFPHLGRHDRIKKRTEELTQKDWAQISHCELIISAGLDLTGDLKLVEWRKSLDRPPPHLCTWVEAFALVGHAVVAFDSHAISDIFDDNGDCVFALTHWPDTARVTYREAGCGNTFQPHGAVDLQRTAATAANLCLDVLQGAVTASCRRTWQGDLAKVTALGGTAAASFDRSNSETSWPWDVATEGREP